MEVRPERGATSADETTLSDDDWPVAEHYRVEPEALQSGPSDEPATTARSPVAPAGRPRSPLPVPASGALLAVVVALVVAGLAAWLLVGLDEEAGTSPRPDRSGGAAVAAPPAAPQAAAQPATTESVPDVTGMSAEAARRLVRDEGLRVRVRSGPSDQPDGEVVQQAPPPESEIAPNGMVVLTVSTGPEQLRVPRVTGLSASEATRMLRDTGLRPVVAPVQSPEPAGTVVDQDPAPGAEVEAETTVRVEVARPQPTVAVPRLVGTQAATARSRLRELGLRVSVQGVESSRPKGQVVGQTPAAGTDLREGGTVTLEVSTGPALVAVPEVVGLDEGAARQQLESAGFTVDAVDEPTSDPSEDGRVIGQNPSAGTQRAAGALVTLRIARLTQEDPEDPEG